MASKGFLKIRAYTSTAKYPLEDVAVTVTDYDGRALAMALTDRNGLIPTIEISVPDKSESTAPDPEEIPYERVNLYAHARGYEQVYAENLQIFADTTTMQDLKMIPLAEYPELYDQNALYITPPQNL